LAQPEFLLALQYDLARSRQITPLPLTKFNVQPDSSSVEAGATLWPSLMHVRYKEAAPTHFWFTLKMSSFNKLDKTFSKL